MDHLRMHSADLTARNIDQLAELFPAVVTETRDEHGEVKRAVDFDLLRQELSDHVVEGPQERYQLDWPGKREALFAANAPIAKTLRPQREESVDFDTTKNLFIEGDNLEALKLLQESYLGKVKLIYIDPPYNTGHDFVYNDSFARSSSEYLERSGQKDESGAGLKSNPESNGRFHSDWLSMMYPRLKLAKSFLADDGIIAVSINDNEQARLGQIMDEMFGPEAKIAQIVIQANKGGRDYLPLAQTHEYMLIYGKSGHSGIFDLPRDSSELPLMDTEGPYEARELRNRNPKFHRGNRPNLYYPFYVNPDLNDKNGYSAVSLHPRVGYDIQALPLNSRGEDSCWRWGKAKAQEAITPDSPTSSQVVARQVRSGSWNVYEKHRPSTRKAKTIWDETEVRTEAGTREVRELFRSTVFDHPKPVDLIKKLLLISTTRSSIVLDFFAGSGSTAHAVMDLNCQDGGKRTFICVQIGEKGEAGRVESDSKLGSISQIARMRIKLAGDRLRKLNVSGSSSIDLGFRSLHIDTTNMADTLRTPDALTQGELTGLVDNVKPGRSGEDLLFQVMLGWGLELNLPIAREEIDGREVFSVDDDALLACFAQEVTPSLVTSLAARKPLRVVFRDSAFATDSARINAEQVFAEISPSTDVKVI